MHNIIIDEHPREHFIKVCLHHKSTNKEGNSKKKETPKVATQIYTKANANIFL